jgi:hypothetical protein
MSTQEQTQAEAAGHPAAAESKGKKSRRSAILIMVVVLLVFIIALVGFVVDLGHIWHTQAQLQTAADSAALGGCRLLGRQYFMFLSTVPRPSVEDYVK